MQSNCLALKLAITDQLPTPKPRQSLPIKHCIFPIIVDQDLNILLTQRPPSGIWGSLWSFPELSNLEAAYAWCDSHQLKVLESRVLESQRHTFSHFHLDYTPLLIHTNNPGNYVLEANTWIWYKAAEIKLLALPAPINRLMQQYVINHL